ncbi:hypothetical protein Tco_0682863 [Tanacetum coccineum]|uniref:Uncharacterized protein n=1 Tax=Tanacetum coccineum TaxID=301880 RepID=A0ABQ4XUB5_9ASTR
MKGAQLSLLNKLPLKEKDPGSFTIHCQVLEKHKEAEDLAADHLSRFENPHMKVLTEREIADKFSDEHLMVLKSKFNNDEQWYPDFVNYIVGKGLESVSIRRIQGFGYDVLEFLGVGTTHGYAVSSLMDTTYWLLE